MQRSHVVITGTGRAGTSLLVQLLTNLGLDTGFDIANSNVHAHCKAGLEGNILDENAPYIVKTPWFCDIADKVLARPDIDIHHVYIPMRDLYAAAESRRHVNREVLLTLSAEQRAAIQPHQIPGGLWHTENPEQQESVLLWQLYKLMFSLSKTTIPVTLMQYPRITTDAHYLYSKLKPILGEIKFKTFERVHAQTVRPEFVSKFGENDG